MVNIIPAKHQHVSIVTVSMLLALAFSSKHCCAQVQHHKGTSMAVVLCKFYYMINHFNFKTSVVFG